MSIRKKRPQWVPVVAAIIRKEGHILLGKRPAGSSLSGIWEFPGGKIEADESPEVALKRELHEEIGIEAEIGDIKKTCTAFFGDVGILLLFFEVPFWKGEPKCLHHEKIKWVPLDEVTQYELPDANKAVLEDLLKS
ncbi:MAG: (deoxy)nucleoside triphosphate pyrophosphohydrolase [Bdellovibrionaceae bacterium]|jgi:8-oxo-dGTP diphosphatase|nr:(deoxy)nucleoside triphosphate pyrophosphohydrolase [Pseudobdellovibrionaceae bacterium]